MIEWSHSGVPPAVVTDVDEKWEDPTGEFDSFGVMY
jgi:acylphosphatase